MLARLFIERADALYLAFRTSCVGRRYSLRSDGCPASVQPAVAFIELNEPGSKRKNLCTGLFNPRTSCHSGSDHVLSDTVENTYRPIQPALTGLLWSATVRSLSCLPQFCVRLSGMGSPHGQFGGRTHAETAGRTEPCSKRFQSSPFREQ